MCFDVNIEIITQNCLKSRHYQEFFLNYRAWASLNVDVSKYTQMVQMVQPSILKSHKHSKMVEPHLYRLYYIMAGPKTIAGFQQKV